MPQQPDPASLFASPQEVSTPSPPPAPVEAVTTAPLREQASARKQRQPIAPPRSEPNAAPPLLLTEREAAAMLTMSPRKLWELRNRGEIPCIRFDRCVRYDPADLRRWIESRKSAS